MFDFLIDKIDSRVILILRVTSERKGIGSLMRVFEVFIGFFDENGMQELQNFVQKVVLSELIPEKGFKAKEWGGAG